MNEEVFTRCKVCGKPKDYVMFQGTKLVMVCKKGHMNG